MDDNKDKDAQKSTAGAAKGGGTSNSIGAKMPCGAVVSNVYEAYEAGKSAAHLASQSQAAQPTGLAPERIYALWKERGGDGAPAAVRFARAIEREVTAHLARQPKAEQPDDDLPTISRSVYGSLEECEREQARRNAAHIAGTSQAAHKPSEKDIPADAPRAFAKRYTELLEKNRALEARNAELESSQSQATKAQAEPVARIDIVDGIPNRDRMFIDGAKLGNGIHDLYAAPVAKEAPPNHALMALIDLYSLIAMSGWNVPDESYHFIMNAATVIEAELGTAPAPVAKEAPAVPEGWRKAMRDLVRVLRGIESDDDAQWKFIANVCANAEEFLAAAPQAPAAQEAEIGSVQAAMDKLGGAIKMAVNMLSRDNTPIRIEAAGALLAAFGEVADLAPTTSTVSAPDVLEQAAKAVESLPCSRDDRKYLLRAAETIRSLKAEGTQAAPTDAQVEKFWGAYNDATQLHSMIDATKKALSAAGVGAQEAPEEVRNQWAKWIVQRGLDLPDHACAECVPHGEIIKPGFQCVYHQALATLCTTSTDQANADTGSAE